MHYFMTYLIMNFEEYLIVGIEDHPERENQKRTQHSFQYLLTID